jgi:hypothetical protein
LRTIRRRATVYQSLGTKRARILLEDYQMERHRLPKSRPHPKDR